MEKSKLKSIIEQVKELSSEEQNSIIKAIVFFREDPLTKKDKELIKALKKGRIELTEANKKLDKIINKIE